MHKALRQIKREQTLKKYKEIYDKVQSGVPIAKLWKPYEYKNEKSFRSAYHHLIVPLYKNK